jgi:hypothetical protein
MSVGSRARWPAPKLTKYHWTICELRYQRVLPKVDFGHFYKFLASTGLVLLGLSVGVPWFLLREQSVLLVDEEQLTKLTDPARRAISARQVDYLWLVNNYRWISGGLALAGSALLLSGLVGWWNRQKVANDKEDAERDEAVVNAQRLTSDERERKLINEVQDVLTNQVSVDSNTEEADGQIPTTSGDQSTSSAESIRDIRREELMAAVRQAETEVANGYFRALSDTHEVLPDVRLGHAIVDLFIRSRNPGLPSAIVEIKYVSQRSSAILIVQAFERLHFVVSRINDGLAPGAPPLHGIVILVFEGEPSARMEQYLAEGRIERFVGGGPPPNPALLTVGAGSVSALPDKVWLATMTPGSMQRLHSQPVR